jgi:phospholipase/lecithinase/hemolysin
VTLAQPNATDPLGNPAYPGYTATNGPNWVDWLTVKYNESLIETVNLAYGGATVDSALVTPYLPTVLSLKAQIQTEFLPLYAADEVLPWKSLDTLFGIFIGINDVGNSYGSLNSSVDLNGLIFAEYASLVEQLYSAGAKNFLFLNVPPVDRSPLTTAQGANASALEAKDIAYFNSQVSVLATNLTTTHKDATAFVFDTNTLFTQVLDDPQRFPETALYKNTTNYCVGYENGTPTEDYFNATCGIPVNEYFWLNSLHPTYPMMDRLANNISQELEAKKAAW